MRNFLLILFVLFFSAGCRSKNQVPAGVLSQKKMQMMLWDMMRADQFLSDYVLNKDSSLNKTTESLKYYQQIFAIHKVSKEDFQKSFSFYKSHPVLFKEIMDSINTPEKNVSIVPAQPKPVTDPAIPRPDTAYKSPQKVMQDTSVRRKRIRPLIAE